MNLLRTLLARLVSLEHILANYERDAERYAARAMDLHVKIDAVYNRARAQVDRVWDKAGSKMSDLRAARNEHEVAAAKRDATAAKLKEIVG